MEMNKKSFEPWAANSKLTLIHAKVYESLHTALKIFP